MRTATCAVTAVMAVGRPSPDPRPGSGPVARPCRSTVHASPLAADRGPRPPRRAPIRACAAAAGRTVYGPRRESWHPRPGRVAAVRTRRRNPAGERVTRAPAIGRRCTPGATVVAQSAYAPGRPQIPGLSGASGPLRPGRRGARRRGPRPPAGGRRAPDAPRRGTAPRRPRTGGTRNTGRRRRALDVDRLTDQIVNRIDDRLHRPPRAVRPRVLTPEEHGWHSPSCQITVEHTGGAIIACGSTRRSTRSTRTTPSRSSPSRACRGPIVQFVNGNLQTLEMELFFDTWDTDQPREAGRARADRPGRRPAGDRLGAACAAGAGGALGLAGLPLRAGRASQKFQMFAETACRCAPGSPVTFIRYHRPRAGGEGGRPADRRLQQGPRRRGGRDAGARSPAAVLRRPAAVAADRARQRARPTARDPGPAQRCASPRCRSHDPDTGEVVR